jgi:hypothetical protein
MVTFSYNFDGTQPPPPVGTQYRAKLAAWQSGSGQALDSNIIWHGSFSVFQSQSISKPEYTNQIPLSSGSISLNNTYLETQTILAEDNNIDLNYGGNNETAVGGGIRVLNALDKNTPAELTINENGDWITNNNLIPNGIVIPNYTPKTSSDTSGLIGSITMDDNYIYVKTSKGWKRSSLENF